MSNYLKAHTFIERRSRWWRVSWFPPDMDWKKGLGRFAMSFVATAGAVLFVASLFADTTLK